MTPEVPSSPDHAVILLLIATTELEICTCLAKRWQAEIHPKLGSSDSACPLGEGTGATNPQSRWEAWQLHPLGKERWVESPDSSGGEEFAALPETSLSQWTKTGWNNHPGLVLKK